MKRSLVPFVALLGLGAIHCNHAADTHESTADLELADDLAPRTPLAAQHCYAEIERPIPADPVVKLGTSLVLKTGGAICPNGVNEKVAYRYYVEKVDRNGNILAPRVSPMGPTEWSFTKLAFDTSNLTPGRYRIYGYSLPRTMIPAWQANDVTARNTSRRTGNAYTEIVTTSWSTGTFGTCGAECGGGTQTRSVVCADNNGTTRPDGWCTGTKPDASQACNEQACPVVQAPNSVTLGGSEDFGLTNDSTVNQVVIGFSPGFCIPDPPFGCWWVGGGPIFGNVYAVQGYWQDPETVARVTVKVSFSTAVTSEGDFTAVSAEVPSAGQATVVVTRTVPGSGTTTYTSAPGAAVIKVRTGSDSRLHALVDDAALGGGGSTIAVKADVVIPIYP